MANPPFGINWQRYHADQQDMPHIAKMGYRSFTIYEWMWSNRDFCNELLSVARKDAIFLDRDHPLSEQKDDQWKNDPAAKGRNHADDWAQKVKDGKVFTPLDRTYFLGLNEPDSNQFQRQIDAYNEAYCRRMAEHGLRAAAYSFGVGHPSTVGLQPKTPPDWSWYAASAAAVLEGHHLAAFHEYGAPTPGGYGWEYWCNRVSACPYPFDAGFDECGIDNGVVNSGQLYGYAKFMSGADYLLWLDGFQVGMAERAHTRKVNLLFYNIFGFDHGSSDSKDWHSFDIRPMRPLLEAFQWTEVQPPSPGPQPVPPPITGPTATPITPAGARIRSGPGVTFSVLGAVAKGVAIRVTGIAPSGTWYRVDSSLGWSWIPEDRTRVGWVSATVVSVKDVENVPVVQDEPTPQPPVKPVEPSDNWERSIQWVLKREGGFQNNPADKGNYYEGRLIGTKFGISAASWGGQYDIPNLTIEQARSIYFEHYWRKSGADKLEWPLCLLVLDTAILHGTGASDKWLAEVGPNPYAFAAKRLHVYTKSDNWHGFGAGWVNRVGDLLEEIGK